MIFGGLFAFGSVVRLLLGFGSLGHTGHGERKDAAKDYKSCGAIEVHLLLLILIGWMSQDRGTQSVGVKINSVNLEDSCLNSKDSLTIPVDWSNDLYHWTLNEKVGDGWKKLMELDYVRKVEG